MTTHNWQHIKPIILFVRHIGERVQQIIFISRAELSELWLGVTTALWGAWLMLPAKSFETASSFTLMGRIANEDVWGMIACIIGMAKVIAVIQGNVRWRKLIALCGVSFWIMVVVPSAIACPFSPGTINYSSLLALNMLIFFNLSWKEQR
ncbi:MAG: hypothetical protein HZB51_34225 [Chloroflexi bacterium]|nr:hypothetical protein [Chloroflexota bacterium]